MRRRPDSLRQVSRLTGLGQHHALTCGGPDWLRRCSAARLTQSGPSALFSQRCLIESSPHGHSLGGVTQSGLQTGERVQRAELLPLAYAMPRSSARRGLRPGHQRLAYPCRPTAPMGCATVARGGPSAHRLCREPQERVGVAEASPDAQVQPGPVEADGLVALNARVEAPNEHLPHLIRNPPRA